MQGGTNLVCGNRVIFWSWFSGGFRFIRNDRGSRRRRGHHKKRGSIIDDGCEGKMVKEDARGKFIKANKWVK
jgi:hypothetical protein